MPFAKKLVENIRKRILLWNGTHGENVHAKLGFAGKAHSQEARRPAHKKDQATRSWGQLWGHLAGRDLQLFIHINNLQTLFGSALRRGLVPIGLKLGGVSSAFVLEQMVPANLLATISSDAARDAFPRPGDVETPVLHSPAGLAVETLTKKPSSSSLAAGGGLRR